MDRTTTVMRLASMAVSCPSPGDDAPSVPGSQAKKQTKMKVSEAKERNIHETKLSLLCHTWYKQITKQKHPKSKTNNDIKRFFLFLKQELQVYAFARTTKGFLRKPRLLKQTNTVLKQLCPTPCSCCRFQLHAVTADWVGVAPVR